MKKIAVLVLTVSFFSLAASAQGIARLANWEANEYMKHNKRTAKVAEQPNTLDSAVRVAITREAALANSQQASKALQQIRTTYPELRVELDKIIATHSRFVELGKLSSKERKADFIVQELYIKTVDVMYPTLNKLKVQNAAVAAEVANVLKHAYWVEVEHKALESWTLFIGLGHTYFPNLPYNEQERIEELSK